MTVTDFEAIPDPGRTMEGLRDTGYDFETAMADIIDNSIAAKASQIFIRVAMNFRGAVRILVADNGEGMDLDGLKLAMKYGSPRRKDPASLGKYGLGLKTASTAFCTKLSVLSRNSANATPWMATWDLKHVVKEGKWLLQLTDEVDDEAVKILDKLAPEASGTVVIWDDVDRLLGNYQDPAGAHAKKALNKKIDQLKAHVAMVYQRFLEAGDKRAHEVSININGEKIEPFDPFQEALSELVAEERRAVVTPDGKEAEFHVRAFILPRREEFPTEELAKAARLSSDNQGIYIYREKRLIHEADWLNMYQKEPHSTLLRVEFSFDHQLDEAFHLDIKKSKIILDDTLWNWLKDQFLPAPRREANRRYRKGEQLKINEKAKGGAHDISNRQIGSKEAEIGGPNVSVSDPAQGLAVLENKRGKFTIKLPMGAPNRPGEVFIQAADDIPDGVLFEPALIQGHKAVRINTEHPYYKKIYIPNMSSSVTIQGIDSLLWSLCVSELSATTDATIENFTDMRLEVSRILRKLVEHLPDPDLEEDVA